MKKTILQFSFVAAIFVLLFSCGGPRDPRDKMIKEDLESLDEITYHEKDTLAKDLKIFFDTLINKQIKPEDFNYLTKISDDNKRLLVLIKMPKLKKVKKDERLEAVDMVKLFMLSREDLRDKELYMAVKGQFTLMLIKTPTYEYSGKLGLREKLYDFYGPRENFEEKK